MEPVEEIGHCLSGFGDSIKKTQTGSPRSEELSMESLTLW
jgi:hypothetical protein